MESKRFAIARVHAARTALHEYWTRTGDVSLVALRDLLRAWTVELGAATAIARPADRYTRERALEAFSEAAVAVEWWRRDMRRGAEAA